MNEDVFPVENGDFPICHLGLQGCKCEFCTQYTLQITQTLDMSGSVTFWDLHPCIQRYPGPSGSIADWS